MSLKSGLAPVGRGRVVLPQSVQRGQIALTNASNSQGHALSADEERMRVEARYRALGGTGDAAVPTPPPPRYIARGRVRVRVS